MDLEDRLGVEPDGSIKKRTITFNANGGGGSSYSEKKSWGSYIELPESTKFTCPSGKSFSHWERRLSGVAVGAYGPEQRTTVWEDMDFYAIWK